MARLTYPVKADGLIVDVLIGLSQQAVDDLRTRGLPVPAPVPCRGLIDTGTDITAISPILPARLGLTPVVQASTTTVSGPAHVDLYLVGATITDLNTPGVPELSQPALYVMGLPAALPTADVLVGLDVLLQCRLELDGPGRLFTLDF